MNHRWPIEEKEKEQKEEEEVHHLSYLSKHLRACADLV
jgi:hypothetical protein